MKKSENCETLRTKNDENRGVKKGLVYWFSDPSNRSKSKREFASRSKHPRKTSKKAQKIKFGGDSQSIGMVRFFLEQSFFAAVELGGERKSPR